ncbi:D-alanyl-D-alanine carboxypeptidase family protein [Dyella sp. C9]|uniref:D-alanyl-D-alanine carboxypeptidase family protein n=1 Tax=Dyella sp. C9 TaxID=2202154 RepID=UPI000DEFC5E7|nr:D-alanyl-D-alanine carboxypeptidase family protein [Dyella sp. C9]
MAIKSKSPGRGAIWRRSLLAVLALCGLGSTIDVAHAGYAAIVINEADGQVITAVNPDEQNHPASLAKMMTLYLAFQALQGGKLKLEQELPVSAWAAAKAPTKLDLRKGQTITVEDCILGMITKSANDAATVMAEGLGGSEGEFVEAMNAQALRLGMTNTHFANASGLPDPNDTTTARDMSKLAMALYHDYPQYAHYFSTKEFMFRGRLVRGHNNLMDKYPGMDGLKTGFTNASGFNLASTAVRDGQRLFSVVLGGRTAASRDRLMARLLDDGFEDQETPAALVAQAAGVPAGGGATQRVLSALSPISTAEAETVPASRRHHRRGKVGTVATNASCTPRKGTKCPAAPAKRSSNSSAAKKTTTARANTVPPKQP